MKEWRLIRIPSAIREWGLSVSFLFEPRDVWVGLYWKSDPILDAPGVHDFTVYVCLLPCLPLRVHYWRCPDDEVPF